MFLQHITHLRQSDQHIYHPIKHSLILIIMSIGLSACQSLPSIPHTPDSIKLTQALQESYADNAKENELSSKPQLAMSITAQNEVHAGLSGYHPIITGANAFAARSILTGMATKSIDVQYYIWHNDEAGQLLLQDLWLAAEKGVIVRFLLDDFNNSADLDAQLLRFASHPNIAVRLVNPFTQRKLQMLNYLTNASRINRRMHNKSFTFDRQLSIIGGRNIGDEYLSNGKTSQFADLDVLLIGDVVADIHESFEDYWQSEMSFDIETLVDNPASTLGSVNNKANNDFIAGLDKLKATATNTIKTNLSIYKQAIKDSTIDTDLINKHVPFRWTTMHFLSDDVKKLTQSATSSSHLVHQLRMSLGKPSKKLTIISSYFVPTASGVDALIKLADQGVEIKILTNSFNATDVMAVHSGYEQWRAPLLKAGIDLYELKAMASEENRENKLWKARSQSSTSLHAKAFAVDNHNVFIGSYNVDPRSANINTEMGVVINDDELAKQLHNAIGHKLLDQAYQVVLTDKGKLQWRTYEDGELMVYDTEPELKFSDHIWMRLMAWLPIDWLL